MVPEASEAAPLWSQIGAALVGAATLAGMIINGLRGKKEPGEEPKHLVLEQAEIADMAPLRDLSRRLQLLFPLIEKQDGRMEEAMKILRGIERDAEIAKEVEDRLRDERMKADREARDRAR